jgi:hypothetical protein
LWNEWEKEGCQIRQINHWNNELNYEQRQIACQIWNLIGEDIGKPIQLERIIEEARRKVQVIIKTVENATLCINDYCQNACDRNDYLTHLQDLRNQLDRATVYSAKVSQKIEIFKPFADRLQPLISSCVWQTYLKQNVKSKSKFISSKVISNYCLILELQSNSVNDGLQISCLMTLEQATEILDQFIDHLTLLCTDQTQALFPQFEKLFPEKHYIDHELSVLKPLLDNDTVIHLDILLEYWKNREQINRICRGCQNMLAQYQILISDKLLVLQNILDLDDQTTGEICIAVYQDYRNHYSNIYSPFILEFMAQWSLSNSLLTSLYSFEATDIDNLLEVVNDWDETLINTKTVLDFVLLKRFFDKMYIKIESIRQERSLEMDDIIACFQEVLNNIESKNIISSIESCSKNLSTIQRLHESQNKEQSKRKRILDIMNNSSFCFFDSQVKGTVNTNKYQFNVKVTSNNWEPISFDDLSDLRDRARLMQYTSSNSNNLQNYTDDHNPQLRSFISLVDTIEVILRSSTSLYEAGYPVVKQYYTSNNKFTCDQGNYHELNNFKSILEAQLADWENQLCNMYQQCINLTYFSGQQISMVDDALHKQTVTITDNSTYHLLKFIGIDPELIETNLLHEERDEPSDLLQTITTVVKSEHDIQIFSIQEDRPKKKKVFLVETTNKGILRAIYSLFHLNNTSVVANQLFYCTWDTNWMEIRAFIYRCFYSQKLHLLIHPETLSIVIQDQFTQLLYQLIEQHPNHLFRLGIITTVLISHLYLINNSNIHYIIQIIHDQEMLSETHLQNIIPKLVENNCILVTSRIAGLGKSNYIRSQALRLDKQLIKFSISGDVDIDILMERLRDKQIQSAPLSIVLHINIGPVENVQQLNEFLYCLILFRCFRLGQMPVCVPTEIPIYIEVDSSSYLAKLIDDITIFKYLPKNHIDTMDWNELESSSSRIQFVANYLQAIEDKTINIRDIHEQAITTLDKSTCIRLLQKHFLREKNLEFISWTQLSIFISVYYKLFSGFSKYGFFVADPTNQSSLRLDILNKLLNSSDQFTSLSVEIVRQNQRSIYTNETFLPLSDAIIQWDKSQPFTLIFTSTHAPLFIFKSRTDVPSSLTDAFLSYYQIPNKNYGPRNAPQRLFYSLFKKQRLTKNASEVESSTKDPKEQLEEYLSDPNAMTHEQFFLRLASLSTKYFTNKPICLICFNLLDYVEQQCSKCRREGSLIRPISENIQDIEDFQKIIAKKLHSEYVFTSDNYIKMLLIYLRVQSNLPVLIMGETGKMHTDFFYTQHDYL